MSHGVRLSKRLMKAKHDVIAEFFDEYPKAVPVLARRLRDLIISALPDAREELDRSGRVVGYSYDSGYSGLVCTIILSKTGVKLGIVGGAKRPDEIYFTLCNGWHCYFCKIVRTLPRAHP